MASMAQSLLLLLLDGSKGTPVVPSVNVKYALAGAVLADLQARGRIELAGGDGFAARPKVTVVNEDPVGDPVLDSVLRELADDKPRSPQAVLSFLSRSIRDLVIDQLVDAGMLKRENGVVTGFLPRAEWPTGLTKQEIELRSRIARAMNADAGAGADRALVALLGASDAGVKTFTDLPRRVVFQAGRHAMAEDWIAQAVAHAIDTVDPGTERDPATIG